MRAIKPVLIVLLAAASSYALWKGYGDYIARFEPDRALRIDSRQPQALVANAEGALRNNNVDLAETYALSAVQGALYRGEAWRVLAAVAELRGDSELALARMQYAAQLAPRDSAAQFWLSINALRDGRLEEAIDRLDRLMSFQPETTTDVFPVLATVAANRAGVDAVAQRLARNPEWRSDFVTRLLREIPMGPARDFLRALRRAGTTLDVAEVNAFSTRLFLAKDSKALRQWLKEFGNPDGLRNGSFDAPSEFAFLDWQTHKLSGADIRIGFESGKTLRVDFYDQRVPFRNVSQILFVAPGAYRLRGRVRGDLEASHGLRWYWECGGSNGASEAFKGKFDWTSFEQRFETSSDCDMGVLQLEVYARIPAEQHLRGWIEFDDLAWESIP